MRLVNTKAGYGFASIVLHWLSAIGVIALFAMGLNAEWTTEAGDRAGGAALMAIHIGLGAVLFVVLLARVVSHYAQTRPEEPRQAKAFNFISALTHHGMLAAIVILMVSGPLVIWSLGEPIRIFGVATLSSPFAESNRGLHELAEGAHGVGRYALWVLVPLHLAGVIKHILLDRDHVLSRMLRPVRE